MAGRKNEKLSLTTSQLFNYARDSYLERTSRPVYAILFLLPFIIFYEIGTILINTDVLNRSQVRVVAFVWLQDLLLYLGTGARFAWVAPPLVVVVILLGSQIASRKPWWFCLSDYTPMVLECILLAVPLIILSLLFNSPAIRGAAAIVPTDPIKTNTEWQQQVVETQDSASLQADSGHSPPYYSVHTNSVGPGGSGKRSLRSLPMVSRGEAIPSASSGQALPSNRGQDARGTQGRGALATSKACAKPTALPLPLTILRWTEPYGFGMPQSSAESIRRAAPAGPMSSGGARVLPLAQPADGPVVRSLLADIVTGVGAGIYEELVFRLVLICALMVLFQDVIGMDHKNAVILAVLISAALFSAHHHHITFMDGHLGRGAPFSLTEFIFRTAAGVYFAALFATRGFGITAGTHAFYDIIATVINASLFAR